MNGSPLYRAHARLASPLFLPLPSPGEHKTEPEAEPFTKLTVESEPVCELSGSQTSTQVRLGSRGFMMRLSCGADLQSLVLVPQRTFQ